MATNKNILDSILQAPGSLASRAFQGVANTAKNEEGGTGDVSRYVIDKLESNAGNLEKLDQPYRQGVARPISTFLQTVKDVGKDGLTPRQTWDRAWERSGNATVGQAGIGALARLTPGKQGADKVNWSDKSSVTNYFEKDNTAAERISGGIDAVTMFFLDPLVFAGKAAKLGRLSLMGVRGTEVKSPITLGRTNLDKLVNELDQARAGKKNAASVVVDSIEKNAGDFVKLEALPIVANSQNPTAVARALSEAAEVSGRDGIVEVLKVGLGDDAALTRIQAQDSILTEAITELKGEISSIKRQMEGTAPKAEIADRPTLTPKQLKNLEANKEKLVAARDEAQAKLDALRTAATPEAEGGIVGKVGSELAWSRNKNIEYLRAKAGEINGRGLFTDYSAEVDSATAKAMHKASVEDLAKVANDVLPGTSSETAFRVLRTVGYFGRGYKTREVPAGSVTIAGEVGDFANREFRARIIAGAKEAGLSAKQQADYYNEFSILTTDSARFQYLEKFEKETLTRTIARNFDTSGMSQSQIATLNDAITKIAQDTLASKAAQMRQIIDEQNYVYIDPKSGKELIFKELQQSVETLAARLAAQAGKPISDTYRNQAKAVLKGTPLTRTQVPNIHFGMDFGLIGNVLKDDKILIPGLIKAIRDEDANSKEINEVLDAARATKEIGLAPGAKEAGSKAWHNAIIPAYEGLQNYFWKPAVLLSLRYTSRNVLDGWGRVLGSFADMGTHNGYSLHTLLSGFFDPSIITAPIKSGAKRTKQRVKAQGLFGTGGARDMEATALAEKIENEAVIGRSFGIEKTDSPETIAEKITKRYKDEGEHFMKESEDILAASLQMASQEFKFFASYRGAAGNTTVARSIAKLGDNIFKIKPSKSVSTPMLDAIKDGNFEAAYRIAINSNPEVIFNTLEIIGERARSASVQLGKLTEGTTLNRTPKLQAHVQRVEEILALIQDNADIAKMAFDNDNRIRIMADYNQALLVSRAPAEKVFAYTQGRVKISKNATIDPALAKKMRRETVSAANSTSRAVLGARRNTLTSVFSGGKSERIVRTDEEMWSGAHAEYMNNILYGDDAGKFIVDLSLQSRSLDNPVVAAKVAKMKKSRKSQAEIDAYMASRYSDDEIKDALLTWIKSPASDAWRKEKLIDLGEYRDVLKDAQWSDITNGIFDEIHRYLPMEGPSGEDMSFLRQALVDDVFDDTYSARIPAGYRHPVYANAEIKGVTNPWRIYKNVVGNLFHMLATLPEDHLVRHPFYNAVYRAEGERLAKQFAKQGVDVNTRTKEIQNAAHAAAHKAVMDRLYTIERHTNVGHMFRFLEPFYMSKQNTTRFWVNATIRNPEIAVRAVQLFSLPYKLGTVYDREDNYKVVNRAGKLNHPWNTKGKVMLLEYPQWMQDKFFAGDSNAKMEVSLAGFDVAFQGQPLGVPQIGSPIGTLALGSVVRATKGKPYDPDKFLEKHGIADFDRLVEYIQPYYEATRGAAPLQQAAGSFGASVAAESLIIGMGGQLGQFDNSINGQKFSNRFRSIEADKLARMAESGVPITGAVIEQIREESVSLAIKSFYAEAFVNGLPIVTTGRYRTMYETLAEPKLRAYRAEFGYDLGTAKFVQEIDSTQGNYVANLITDSTIDNRFGFNSSEATLEGIYPNSVLLNRADSMVGDQSFIGTLFNQGDFVADRSDTVADILYNVKINGKPVKYRAEEEFTAAEDLQVRAGNKDYYAGVEVIEQHARERGINKGTKAYEEFYGVWKDNWTAITGEKYPLWLARDEVMRRNRVEKNLAAATLVLSDAKYMETVGNNNPMAMATAEYLRGRVKLQEELERAIAASGNTTIDASKNAYVADLRDNYVKALDQKYPGFQRVHDIYFNNDKLNDTSIYQTGYAFGETE
jgi:hypothetical protein